MWRSKRFIIIAVLAAELLAGSIGGIALADDEDNDGQVVAPCGALWDRAAEILRDSGVEVTSDQLQDAFVQAGNEARQAAMEDRLAELVEEGAIDQAQADEYLQWWQSRPDGLEGFGFRGHRGFHNFGGMHGFGGGQNYWGMSGFPGPRPPAE
jgi:hypothetical protein